MSEIIENSKNTADAIVVGGGAVGLHTAHAMHEAMSQDGKRPRILAVTQESEWGGLAGRSLEQFRMFNDSYAMAEIVAKSMKMYDQLGMELIEQNSRATAYEHFPYVFTVGNERRPDHVNELLPDDASGRADMEYYRNINRRMKRWGVDPQAYELDAGGLRKEFPMLDGDGIESAMVVDSAGRLHFDVMRSWMMDRTRTDGNGRGVTYRANTTARKILLGKNGEAIGVDFDGEKVYSDTIVLAIGAFALKLPQLLAHEESERIAGNFTITQRELFFANMPGVQDETNFFLISPDMAIARISTREGHASYGYAAEDDPVITKPETDPRPQTNRRDLFVGRTYALLAECSSRWDPDNPDVTRPNMAVKPSGYSAGYYAAYRDDLPVVGKIGDTNVTLAAGSHHSGVMGGHGIALLAVDHALDLDSDMRNISPATHEQTDINRTPVEHTGLVL